MIKSCKICNKIFKSKPSEKRKFCSRNCYGVSKIGTKLSLDIRKKISDSHAGINNPMFGVDPWNKGIKVDNYTGDKNGNWKGGPSFCKVCKKKLSQRNYKVCLNHRDFKNIPKGENHYLWKGGVTPLRKKMERTKVYKLWRTSVFKRDNYTCQICGDRSKKGNGVVLNADHIKSFNLFPELRTELSNGRTLCLKCHKKTDTYGIKSARKKL